MRAANCLLSSTILRNLLCASYRKKDLGLYAKKPISKYMSQTVVRFKDYMCDSARPVITGERALLRIQVFYFELNEARFFFYTKGFGNKKSVSQILSYCKEVHFQEELK